MEWLYSLCAPCHDAIHRAAKTMTLRKATELAPDAPQPKAALAQLELRTGNTDEALRISRAMLEKQPKDPSALASLDRIYESQGMYENLAAILRQRLTITDDNDELVKLNLRLGQVKLKNKGAPSQATFNFSPDARRLGVSKVIQLDEACGG